MRTIPAEALAKIATLTGEESLFILDIEWNGPGTGQLYCDKQFTGINGCIKEIDGLDEVVQVSGGGNSQQINVTLYDKDGSIKTIYDTIDVHKKAVRVYQWFQGLAFDKKFLLFKGQINSPVIWDEGERTLEFTVLNRIEDVEVGFSAEEGDFPMLPDELIGKTWPLCFGTVINVPALKAVPAVSGTVAAGVGIADFTLSRRIGLAEKIVCPREPVGFKCSQPGGAGTKTFCNIAYQTDTSCLQARCVEIEKLRRQKREQKAYEYTQIRIYGGLKFPQGRLITLDINGGKFIGFFNGDIFTIVSRKHPKDDGTNHVIVDPAVNEIKSNCAVVTGFGSGSVPVSVSDCPNTVPSLWGPLVTNQCVSRKTWEAYRREPTAGFFWAGGGTTVTMATGNEITYIANILPSTILRVAAYRTVNGNRYLLTVPSEFFEIRETNYTGYQVMEIVFDRPLSLENQDQGGGWEDDIYVTLESSVGPNTADILRWFIETYTEYSVDSASFDALETRIENYPMHFPLLTRPSIINVLQAVATQGRCALWMKNDTFYTKYLSETPDVVDTITENDILEKTLKIELSKTEQIVTKYTAEWRKDYAIPDPNTLILRHNVKKYGTQDKKENYYTYNILDLVRKSLTFWLIRRANTWKRLKFSTALTKLNLESFDAISITLPDVADGTIVGVVEKAVYNSAEHRIDFEVWTPVKSGTRTPYNFAFPADIDENALFPTIEERNLGFAGSGTDPNFSTIAPPGHPLQAPDPNVIQGFGLLCNGDATPIGPGTTGSGECRQDHGDKKPSDEGDEKPQPEAIEDETGDVSADSSPITDDGTGFDSKMQQLQDDAQRANENAEKAREQAQRASDNSGGDQGKDENGDPGDGGVKPKDLEDPSDDGEKSKEDLKEECIFTVTYERIRAKTVAQPEPKKPTVTESGQGRIATSTLEGIHNLFFNDWAAANAYAQTLQTEWNVKFESWLFETQQAYSHLLSGPGAQPDPVECPPADEPGIVGYNSVNGEEFAQDEW